MPFDHMRFIGDNGSGDQYFYPILAGSVQNLDIYLWNHEHDSRQWFAARMQQFLARVILDVNVRHRTSKAVLLWQAAAQPGIAADRFAREIIGF